MKKYLERENIYHSKTTVHKYINKMLRLKSIVRLIQASFFE